VRQIEASGDWACSYTRRPCGVDGTRVEGAKTRRPAERHRRRDELPVCSRLRDAFETSTRTLPQAGGSQRRSQYVLDTALLEWTNEYAVRTYTTADSAVSYLNRARIA